MTCLKLVGAPFVNLQWNIARAQNAVFCDSALSAVFQVWCVRAIIFVHSDRHMFLASMREKRKVAGRYAVDAAVESRDSSVEGICMARDSELSVDFVTAARQARSGTGEHESPRFRAWCLQSDYVP